MKPGKYLSGVRDQYEDFPYPKRNPEDERKRLHAHDLYCLDCINHYCYSGRKDFTKGGRILVAGGGTGDAVILLAEQLRDADAEIVYLDMSAASMDIARRRSQVRGLENITWVHASILDLPDLKLGQFDHINCTGVLHHLANPDAGLSALVNVLASDGCLGLMVYARYGRLPIYPFQELMRLINVGEKDSQARIDNCRKVLRSLPANHWMVALFGLGPKQLGELDDVDIYDMFLHAQDRSYSIPELYEFARGAGVSIIRLLAYNEKEGTDLYDPGSCVSEPDLLAKIRRHDPESQQAIAELLHGRIMTHLFYAARSCVDAPRMDDLDNIPALAITNSPDTYETLLLAARGSNDVVRISNPRTRKSAEFRKTVNTDRLLKYLDGRRTLKEIFDKVISSPGTKGATYPRLTREFMTIYDALNRKNLMYLRHKSVGTLPTIAEMEARAR